MIEMGVGEHNCIQLFRIEGEGFPIHEAKVFVALEQAAINQQSLTPASDERF